MPDRTALTGKHQIRPLPFQPPIEGPVGAAHRLSSREQLRGCGAQPEPDEQELARVTKDTPPLASPH